MPATCRKASWAVGTGCVVKVEDDVDDDELVEDEVEDDAVVVGTGG
jgi:hypothetical protein